MVIMDGSMVMDVRQEANGFGYGGETSPGTQQDSYAVLEKDSLTGFFQDAEFLEYSPFDEDDSEGGFQEAAPTEMYPDGEEERLPVLPVEPVMVQEQMTGQISEYSVELGWENPAEKDSGQGPEGSWEGEQEMEGSGEAESEPEECCMDENAQEEPDADEISEEETLQEDKSAENSAEKAAEEDRKRAEHEASEAKRKAEWEARQQAKRDAEALQMAKLSSLTDEELTAEAMKRIGTDTEKLTRRNMKDCVSEYIQTLCLEDTAFARLAMHPRKTMVHCFHYINRKAREFVEQEMKDNDIKPENGIYGSDVPDGLCYQWAEDYFRDPNAEEDREKEEKFVPKPYAGKAPAKSKSQKAAQKKSGKKKDKSGETAKAGTKASEKVSGQKALEKKEDDGQISFMGQMSFGDFSFEEVKAG